MHLSPSYFEMNHAVPGPVTSPLMETSFECQVPSPSHWSDSCCSPPSLHSPSHFASDFVDKLKEEPLSPGSYPSLTSPLSFYSYSSPPMSKESGGGEASLDLAELLAENQTLISNVRDNKQPTRQHPPTFLDTLIKQEFNEQSDFVSTTQAPLATAAPSVSSLSVTVPESSPTTSGNAGDVLCIALEHYRQNFEEVSNMLNISRDPSKWSVQNVKAWLQFEASKLKLPVPFVDHWQIPGANLVQLTESQFRDLIPEGGNLFYANLEIWKAASRTSIPEHRLTPPVSHMQHIFDFHPTVSQAAIAGPSTYQPRSPSHMIPQVSPGFRVPTTLIPTVVPSTPTRMASPGVQVLSQLPTSTSIPISVSAAAVSLGSFTRPMQSPPAQVPTSVMMDDIPSPKPRPTTPSSGDTAATFSRNPLSALLGPDTVPQTVLASSSATTSEGQLERTIPENVVDEPAPAPSSGRGSTHIHLWQFLKELLQKPHEHGACIRWLDRSKGVFKIEDSVRVARLWGRRKNRPAMNYDKLSRSIRQYYKKGIMKKTERSQRLVYQFCHPYCL